MAMALTLFKSELDVWEPGEHNGTFRGNNLAFVTAARPRAVLGRRHLPGGAGRKDRSSAHRHGQDRRAREGLLHQGTRLPRLSISFPDPDTVSKVAAEAYKRNMLVETSGPQDEVVKLMPALNIPDEDLQKGLAILEEAVLAATGQMGEPSRLRAPH
ncbi:hypothetical protein [Nesterenkonia pannonica]|uniref:hypothetical protein n=1 Tax=Nesterenkonia pannonica TaxID=1548602 RepID=UPI0021642DA8|nr:hypothetical protein [Nesterenkonia pannonica]